jgi:hypothetical protein
MIIHKLRDQGLIQPPKWLPDNTAYLTVTGSMAYGVSRDSSDEDLIGFCLPPKDLVFPHLSGEIPGFGTQMQRFNVWEQHHVKTLDGQKEYDFSIYSIVKLFQLCMENNPNMIDAIFTPMGCVKHITEVGRMVVDNRRLFLHKGYSYSQVHKMDIKRNDVPEVVALREFCAKHDIPTETVFEVRDAVLTHSGNPPIAEALQQEFVQLCDAVLRKGRRFHGIARFGYDVKFAYHVVRLLNEVEQILTEGDLDLQRGNEQLKSIRRGEWTQQQIIDWFAKRESELDTTYTNSKLPDKPDERAIKALLMDCLEHHYGDISTAVTRDTSVDAFVRDLDTLIAKYR